jgi:hypothetical protein
VTSELRSKGDEEEAFFGQGEEQGQRPCSRKDLDILAKCRESSVARCMHAVGRQEDEVREERGDTEHGLGHVKELE